MSEIQHTESRENFELTLHVLPGEAGRDHITEMAEAFVVEFKRMRWTDDAILLMFKNPFYAGPFCVYQEKGEQFVVDLINSIRKS